MPKKKSVKKAVRKTGKAKVPKSVGLSFKNVVESVSRLHTDVLRQTTKAVNVGLTLRNWLIGAYIHEYELRGADRAKYGENLVPELADALTRRGVSGCDSRELWRYLRFFRFYPQILLSLIGELRDLGIDKVAQNSILGSLSPELQLIGMNQVAPNAILGALTPELQLVGTNRVVTSVILGTPAPKLQPIVKKHVTNEEILQSEIAKSLALKLPGSVREPADDIPFHSGDEILEKLSYSHIAQLVGIDDHYRRVFYEMECMKGNWSVRELRRQISSLYFERTALSKDKVKLREIVKQRAEVAEPKLIIRDPLIFEFLDLKPGEAMLEENIECQMLDRLQETLLEFGRGFCFEARQKRLLIGGEHFFIDLVFYHRILKCHVLIELKDDEFRHEHLGQLNTYVSWYKKNMMVADDEPPVGILLCTGKNQTLVEYALAGMSNNLFVSRYLAELPTREELMRIVQTEP